MVALRSASWNQLEAWLRAVDTLRMAAQRGSAWFV